MAVVLTILASASPGQAVQLPGVSSPLPPGVERTFELLFSNDFLGRGGEFDDHRTQQIGFVASVARRWTLIVDHSILTLEDRAAADRGRVDHLSASVGYALVEIDKPALTQVVEVGGGFRYSGEIGGARMQNGFHQIVGSKPTTVPYVGTDRVDGTLWVRLPRQGVLKRAVRLPLVGGGWDFGYWGRASTLLTTDSEWDGSVGLSAVATRGWFQGWLGVQGDWRTGHDRDIVSSETARFEQGAGGVLGFRFGPLLIETVQHFDGGAAYGHLSLVSTGDPLSGLASEGHALSLQAGLSIPDVLATFQGRWSNCRILGCSADWLRTVLVDFRSGRPQFGRDANRYAVTRQLSAAFELERAPIPGREWLSVFGALGAGWRNERLEGVGGEIGGVRSDPVGRAGLVGDMGLRFGTSAAGRWLSLMVQLGLSGWIPASGGTVEFAGEAEQVQRPQLILVSGVVVRFARGSR
ncbi:MAG: hypothetical protein ACWGSQ_03210 [Longimicrobiales bacterium]